MIDSTLWPFLIGTIIVIVGGMMAVYDPFRVGAHTALLLLSVFLASVVSWSLWITGNAVVVSWFATDAVAWDVSLIASMIAGPVLLRWAMGKIVLSDDTHLRRDVMIAFAGALIGAFAGRFALSELYPTEYSAIGNPGSARPMWVWTGSVVGGHAHAMISAFRGILARREP
jgi:hypothetical protein